ncbi:hypothetical protein D3C76_953810 [compost metagenome]
MRTISRKIKLVLKKPATAARPSVNKPITNRRRIGRKSESRLYVIEAIENIMEYPVTIQEADAAVIPKASVTSGSARLNIAVFMMTRTTATLNSRVSRPSRGRGASGTEAS